MGPRYTAAEEDLISQISSVLGEVAVPREAISSNDDVITFDATPLTTHSKSNVNGPTPLLRDVAVPRVASLSNNVVTLDKAPITSVKRTINAERPTQISISQPCLDTPDILQEFIDFEMAAQQSSQQSSNSSGSNNTEIESTKLTSFLLSPLPSPSARAPSPITKEQILDFLQDKPLSPSAGSSVGGSESGYDSVTSPKSSASYESCSLGSPDVTGEFDMESFVQLFPSLM